MQHLPHDIGRQIAAAVRPRRGRSGVTRSFLVDLVVYVAWVSLVGLLCLPFL